MKWFVTIAIFAFHLSCSTVRGDKVSKFLKAPPGTVRLNDTLFIDKTEIGNVHWREFVYALLMRDNDTAASIKNTPDTTIFKDYQCYGGPYVFKYFSHPAFNYYPVVGITYEQAVAFCEWRSRMVNWLYNQDPRQNPYPNKKYHYRLPTIEEWESAANKFNNINAIPYGYNSVKGDISLICDTVLGRGLKINRIDNYTTNSKNRIENKHLYDLYNMIGNVSEITATKGIAKGGNFLLPLDSCTAKSYQTYTKPEVWLGFRCVCEIVKE